MNCELKVFFFFFFNNYQQDKKKVQAHFLFCAAKLPYTATYWPGIHIAVLEAYDVDQVSKVI